MLHFPSAASVSTAAKLNKALIYARLSNEDSQSGESSSISNQREIIRDYCSKGGFEVICEFTDDGWSGGNFKRPGFQDMLEFIRANPDDAFTIITKDLSRLGRDMREVSYYTDVFFPENNIRYIAIADNFDTLKPENALIPFQFAMNEVYLRDGSRKVKEVLKNKRENGKYCACPPYGYKKDPRDNSKLVLDEQTAPIVQKIFEHAAKGDSSHVIAATLNAEGVIPPLKYRVLYRDNFSDEGASHACDTWNATTVKRILKNRVYLGHTILGKQKKVSFKSSKKTAVPAEQWAVTCNTHEPLVSQAVFDDAQKYMAKGNKDYRKYEHVRKSIFSGIAFCKLCGHAMCSAGSVYKGEREKYWYLSCIYSRKDLPEPCSGTRILYTDLLEVVRRDLNSLIALSDEQILTIQERIIGSQNLAQKREKRKAELQKAKKRITAIDDIMMKLYSDYSEGSINAERFKRMQSTLEEESTQLANLIKALSAPDPNESIAEKFAAFFSLVKKETYIEELTRDVLTAYVERIEIGPKIFEGEKRKATHPNTHFTQEIHIKYKFIGELDSSPNTKFPLEDK